MQKGTVKTPRRKIISSILNAAAVGVALTSPRGSTLFVRQLLKRIFPYADAPKHVAHTTLSQSLYYLKRRKLIRMYEQSGKTVIELTEQGRKRKLTDDFENVSVERRRAWDHAWRLVLFDVPESKRFQRDAFRRKLQSLGFLQFQKSVWIYPYECTSEIDFVTEFLSIPQYVNVLTIHIQNDRSLRNHFDL